jgi:hypothetical protein
MSPFNATAARFDLLVGIGDPVVHELVVGLYISTLLYQKFPLVSVPPIA